MRQFQAPNCVGIQFEFQGVAGPVLGWEERSSPVKALPCVPAGQLLPVSVCLQLVSSSCVQSAVLQESRGVTGIRQCLKGFSVTEEVFCKFCFLIFLNSCSLLPSRPRLCVSSLVPSLCLYWVWHKPRPFLSQDLLLQNLEHIIL